MLLSPRPPPPVPAATARIARAAFPKGHPSLAAADALGAVFTASAFAALFPRRGQPALAPWRRALATALQFAAGLSDRQAADAVRARLDRKDVLRLDVADPGSDASVLCDFRGRPVVGGAGWLLFEAVLAWARAAAAQGAGATTDRLDAPPRRRARPQSHGSGRRDRTPRAR